MTGPSEPQRTLGSNPFAAIEYLEVCPRVRVARSVADGHAVLRLARAGQQTCPE